VSAGATIEACAASACTLRSIPGVEIIRQRRTADTEAVRRRRALANRSALAKLGAWVLELTGTRSIAEAQRLLERWQAARA